MIDQRRNKILLYVLIQNVLRYYDLTEHVNNQYTFTRFSRKLFPQRTSEETISYFLPTFVTKITEIALNLLKIGCSLTQ